MKIFDTATLRHEVARVTQARALSIGPAVAPSKGALAAKTVASVNDLLINARRLIVCRASCPDDSRGILKICAFALTTKRAALIKMRHLGKNARC